MNSSRKQFLKQSALLLGGSLLPAKKIIAGFGRTLDTYHPADCSWDLKQDTLFELNVNTSKAEFPYYNTTAIKDVQYGDENTGCTHTANDCNNLSSDYNGATRLSSLRYCVYYPTGHDYSNHPLPAVVLFHAGGYSDCLGSFDYDPGQVETLAQVLCTKGFIAFSVQYRRGKIEDDTSGSPAQGFTSAQKELAVYRAQQDGRGAIRSIMRRNSEDQHGGLFTINTGQFFIGGLSAGAGIANGICYYGNDQPIINSVFPKKATSGYPSVQDTLGDIQEDYYYGSLTETWPSIAGLLNCWGGIVIPSALLSNPFDFFGDINLVPMIAFQGEDDRVVVYDNIPDQYVFYSPTANPDFIAEDYCTDLTTSPKFTVKSTPLPVPSTSPYIVLSTFNMHCYLKLRNIYTELYADSTMEHGINDNNDNFGITVGSSYVTDVITYIGQRAACFFQAIMNGKATYGATGRAEFRDCENYRVKCSPWSSSNACSNNSSNNIPCN